MRTYDTYKDSGISWLGQIPSHWDVKRAKVLFNKENRPVLPNDEVVTCFRDGQVTLRKNRRTEGFTESLKEIGYQGVRKGDLVIHQMDAFAGATGVSDSNGKGTPVYHVCTPKTDYVNNYYYAHIVRRMGLNGYIQSLYRGIRERSSDFRFDVFGRQFLPVPPLAEQEAIVAYLDSATAEIDKAIASQQRMVELLQERKQIIINQAVTRGLNPDAPMKPTNIDWLPKIPALWQLIRMKYLLKSPLQYGANESPESTDTNLPRYIRITDIKENGELNDDSFVSLSWEKAKDYLLQKGDILFARSGATVGKTYLFEEQYASCFAGYLIKARCNDGLLPEFLHLFTKSGVYDKWKESIFIKSTIQNIGADKYSNLPIPYPPYDEQKVIVEYIESTISPVNSAISRCERIIALLTERKQILINDVVTGKIKVV